MTIILAQPSFSRNILFGCSCALLGIAGCDLRKGPFQEIAITEETAKTPSAPNSPPANPSGKTLIELIKCEANAITISQYKLSATYRFVSGSPKTNLGYMLDVSFPGCPFHETKRIPGAELALQGTIEWTYELPGIGARGESEVTHVRFQFSEEFERQGNQVQFLGVSHPVTVKLDTSKMEL
jgi:hypothetical protein